MTDRQKGFLLALTGSAFWGGSGVAAQYLFTYGGMTSEYLVVVRMIIAGILLLAIDSFSNDVSIWKIWQDKASRWRLLAFGFVGMLGVQYTYFVAIEYSDAPTATILQYLMPIIVIAWTAITTKQLPALKQVLTACSAIFGTAILVTHGNFTTLSISTEALLWGIISAFAAAFYTCQPRWLLMRWPSTQVIGWAMIIGGIGMGCMYPPLEYPGTVDMMNMFALGYLIVFGTAAAFWAYVTSTKYIQPSEASILNATEPLTSVIFGVLLLGVVFQLPEIIGSLFIVIPIAMITGKKSKD